MFRAKAELRGLHAEQNMPERFQGMKMAKKHMWRIGTVETASIRRMPETFKGFFEPKPLKITIVNY